MAGRGRVAWVLLAVLGCRGEAVTPPGAAKSWAAMDRGERTAHMTTVVLPRMRARFQGHDPRRFADFGCATCHGPDAAARGYAMPNPGLLQLHRKHFRREIYLPHREMVRFMWGEVQPAMAELLGLPESRYGRGPGFNCRNCHVRRAD